MADWLGRQAEKQKTLTKKILLICCCLFTGGYCIGLIFGVIRFELLEPAGITRPNLSKHEVLTKAEPENTRLHLVKFRRYMDSLGTTSSGRQQRDSILIKHPGIMDTVARLEKITHSK